MRYITLLRGINVSGQKKVKMNDLKSLYEGLGLQGVVTYIQSGNVIFNSQNKDSAELKASIEKAIQKKYEFNAQVVIRTTTEISSVIKNCPFGSVDLEKEGTKVLVTFLSSKPSKSRIEEVLKFVVEPEILVSKGTEIYLYCPNGYGKSKLSNTFLEKKLGVGATTRNWKSVNALCELANE